MLSKTRTTIITLVAAFSFSGAAIVPTVAQAATKETPKEAQASCESLFNNFSNRVDKMQQALNAKDSTGFSNAKGEAENYMKAYESKGCDAILARTLPTMPKYGVLGMPPVVHPIYTLR